MARPMWLVRADSGGRLAADFQEKGIVAIGWKDVRNVAQLKDRADFLKAVMTACPEHSRPKAIGSASQLFRFFREMKVGDRVVTYDNARRTYLIGNIESEALNDSTAIEDFPNVRKVKWSHEVSRDELTVTSKNSLGSTLTLFVVPAETEAELEGLATGQPATKSQPVPQPIEEDDLLRDMQDRAREFIKDRVSKLDWDELQRLVAGLLRAMGYKTRISPSGPDRGKDIVASPDGFGFEQPRIIVEVKHRRGQMGAPEVRGFLGVIRHAADKGLYVSTGGFSKEAYYEAERAANPITLMDLDDLVAALVEHYENVDTETRVLLPLTKVYWPA